MIKNDDRNYLKEAYAIVDGTTLLMAQTEHLEALIKEIEELKELLPFEPEPDRE